MKKEETGGHAPDDNQGSSKHKPSKRLKEFVEATMPQWEKDMREHYEKDIAEGMYTLQGTDSTMFLSKQGVIDYEVAKHRAFLGWQLEFTEKYIQDIKKGK